MPFERFPAGVRDAVPDPSLIWVRRGIWVYFWLLILEGAVRKWVLPGLSAPLLLVRDPILMAIYVLAFHSRKIRNPRLSAFAFICIPIVALAGLQVALGIVPAAIAVFGVRSYLLHLPLVLIVAEAFTFDDVKAMGKWILIASVPMVLLMALQYQASGDSWLNAGAGQGSTQIYSAGGHVRAAGTFSFATGVICFFPLAEAYLFYALSRSNVYPNWVTLPATASVMMALPLSGSRTLLFVMVVVLVSFVLAGLRSPRDLTKLLQIGTVVFVCSLLAFLTIPLIRDAIETFQDRWQQASYIEGDVQDVLSLRILDVVGGAFDSSLTASWTGAGIGMGSNVAAYLKTGAQDFLLAEMEWPRVVLEFGPFLGLAFMTFRVIVCIDLLFSAFHSMKNGSSLAWLLVPATVPFWLIHSMEQTTNLGFMVMGAGLCFAAANRRPHPRRAESRSFENAVSLIPQNRRLRLSRSS